MSPALYSTAPHRFPFKSRRFRLCTLPSSAPAAETATGASLASLPPLLPPPPAHSSLLLPHNETINVWSHLLGFFWAVYISLYDHLVFFPAHEAQTGDPNDRWVFTFYQAGILLCMLASATYHLFMPQREDVTLRWLQVDLLGISLG